MLRFTDWNNKMGNLKEKLKKSDNIFIKIIGKVYHNLWCCTDRTKYFFNVSLFYIFRIIPIKKNKVIATTFSGKKYGDNTGFIVEELIKINPKLDIVWAKDDLYDYEIPDNIRTISFWNHKIKKIYEYATAKVWIDTHAIRSFTRKRKGQLFIETWHGGLGIKKLHGDSSNQNKSAMKEIDNMSEIADVFISNSDHLTKIYRSAFGYKGKVWKSGYPKNDIILSDNGSIKNKVKEYYNLNSDCNILVYAPTFRDSFYDNVIDMSVYDINYSMLHSKLVEKFGGEWVIMVKYHPIMINSTSLDKESEYVIDATAYPDVQEIILAADAFISDYSSCIFDAALREIPCFTFAVDFEEYKGDRGVYYEMEELPFPYAKNNEELLDNISDFNLSEYKLKWDEFKKMTGFYETGHAAKDIGYVINEYINGNKKPLEEIKYED